jgi:hypothetical protein
MWLLLLSTLLVASCLEPDDISDGGSDADVQSDIESGVDADVEISIDGDVECPVGSGYPCACLNTDEQCDDGSDCARFSTRSIGFCSPRCDGTADLESCLIDGYGLEVLGGGLCAIASAEGLPLPEHCVVVCDLTHDGVHYEGACPAPLECIEVDGIGICI